MEEKSQLYTSEEGWQKKNWSILALKRTWVLYFLDLKNLKTLHIFNYTLLVIQIAEPTKSSTCQLSLEKPENVIFRSSFLVQKSNLYQQTNHSFVMFFQIPISDKGTV